MCSSSRKVASLVVSLLLAGALEARELRVCADPNNLPFSNEQREGFENKIAELIAADLGATVQYTWWAQRRGFLRNTLNAGECDLVAGVPPRFQGLRTTKPYYRSTYVFVTRADGPSVASYDDPVLRDLKVGIQLIGDDGWNTPPAHAISRRGIVGNVRGFMIYGDYSEPNPSAAILRALAEREIDVAIVWGPLGGYFSTQYGTPMKVTPVQPAVDEGEIPMLFDIAMGARKGDEPLRDEIQGVLDRRRADVDAILAAFRVPVVDSVAKPEAAQ
jgi:mxaJ protein